jgi:hypothetical protein
MPNMAPSSPIPNNDLVEHTVANLGNHNTMIKQTSQVTHNHRNNHEQAYIHDWPKLLIMMAQQGKEARLVRDDQG